MKKKISLKITLAISDHSMFNGIASLINTVKSVLKYALLSDSIKVVSIEEIKE